MCESCAVFHSLHLVSRAHVDLVRVASALCSPSAV
ncbi:putative leader peptide [Streptomyces sp. NPDC006645]